jgi:hypothetical protein
LLENVKIRLKVQPKVELVLYVKKSSLKKIIELKERKRKCKYPLKDFRFDRDDPMRRGVFSPGIIAQRPKQRQERKSKRENTGKNQQAGEKVGQLKSLAAKQQE